MGGKTIETDPAEALDDVRRILEQLLARIPELIEEATRPADRD